MFRLKYAVIMLILSLFVSGGVLAQDETVEEFTGTIDSESPIKEYILDLVEGNGVLVLAEATSGDLDTYLYLLNPDGDIVASNDDRNGDTLDSALGYLVGESGEYTLQVTRYEEEEGDSSGDYVVTVTIGDESVLNALDELTRIQLTGEMRALNTPHFRIHYTFEGDDAITQTYLDAVAATVEEVWAIEIEQMGWPPPPSDGILGGDNRYDIYLMDLIGSGEGSLGYASPESIIGDNPASSNVVEESAGTSYIAVENDFRDVDGGTAISLMRATMAHEFHHSIQFGFDVNDPLNWYYETTATWMETASLSKDQDATGYISYTYEYPELCLGTENDPGEGQLMYGDFTFIQTLVDMYGEGAVVELWNNIATADSFDALENMLAPYNVDVPTVVANFRLKNLARDYELAPEFGATVWMENTIADTGRWTYTGEGIQELGANYFGVEMPEDGVYYAALVNDGASLELWAVGVTEEKVEAARLGRGGNFDTSLYDDTYLMVLNPQYDNDVSDCVYYDYDIEVTPAKGEPGTPTISFPATYYEPLG